MHWRYAVLMAGTCWWGSPANSQTTAADRWAAMTKCAAITADVARHRCSDDVLRDAGLLAPHFGLETSPARVPQAAATQAAASAAKRPGDDRAQATLAAVAAGADGKLVLTTTDGAVWHQVESNAVRPAPTQGQILTIERTSFGGFMCKSGKWVTFRCYRAR